MTPTAQTPSANLECREHHGIRIDEGDGVRRLSPSVPARRVTMARTAGRRILELVTLGDLG